MKRFLTAKFLMIASAGTLVLTGCVKRPPDAPAEADAAAKKPEADAKNKTVPPTADNTKKPNPGNAAGSNVAGQLNADAKAIPAISQVGNALGSKDGKPNSGTPASAAANGAVTTAGVRPPSQKLSREELCDKPIQQITIFTEHKQDALFQEGLSKRAGELIRTGEFLNSAMQANAELRGKAEILAAEARSGVKSTDSSSARSDFAAILVPMIQKVVSENLRAGEGKTFFCGHDQKSPSAHDFRILCARQEASHYSSTAVVSLDTGKVYDGIKVIYSSENTSISVIEEIAGADDTVLGKTVHVSYELRARQALNWSPLANSPKAPLLNIVTLRTDVPETSLSFGNPDADIKKLEVIVKHKSGAPAAHVAEQAKEAKISFQKALGVPAECFAASAADAAKPKSQATTNGEGNPSDETAVEEDNESDT